MKQGWWLYSNDLQLAIRYQRRAAAAAKLIEEKAKNISMLTYLGEHTDCEAEIIKQKIDSLTIGKQALCRARRGQQKSNTWASLSSHGNLAAAVDRVNRAVGCGHAVCILLVGGIGDQLEAASLVLAHQRRRRIGRDPDLKMKAEGQNSKVVMDHLKNSKCKHLLANSCDKFAVELSTPMYRYWMERTKYLPLMFDSIHEINNDLQEANTWNILVCWRCKKDPQNQFSSFSRSVPFASIIEWLKDWSNEIEEKTITINDISEYSDREHAILKSMFPKINLIRKKIKSLGDTVQLVENSHEIITVDTSLGHLAATSEAKTNLLLPLHPDERWLELPQSKGVYMNNIRIYQQKVFNCWEEPLGDIRNYLGRRINQSR